MIEKIEDITLPEFTVAGISIRTINQNGQSQKDLKALWVKFMAENVFFQLTDKVSDHIYCVYAEYETDHTNYYTTVLGCEVDRALQIPGGFTTVTIPAGNYREYSLSGKCPHNLLDAWQKIWDSSTERKYASDYDRYTPNWKNFEDSEVKIFLSVK